MLEGINGEVRLGFLVDDNRVVVSTVEELHSAKYQVVRVYNLMPMMADLELNGNRAVEIGEQVVDALKSAIRPESCAILAVRLDLHVC